MMQTNKCIFNKQLFFTLGLTSLLLCCGLIVIDDLVEFTSFYPNTTLVKESDIYNNGKHIGKGTWYITPDSPEIVRNWFEENGWFEGQDRSQIFGSRGINFGVFKVGRSIVIIEDGNVTIIQVYTSVYLPFYQ